MNRSILALCLAPLALLACPAPASTLEGECLESWALTNVQPASATYAQTVASESYRGRTTVIVLLSSG